ncbi:hypothetical protein ACLB1M_09235 [Escherichia coli]
MGYNGAARIIQQMERGIVSEQGHNGNAGLPPPFDEWTHCRIGRGSVASGTLSTENSVFLFPQADY